jgi:hypothetical protein
MLSAVDLDDELLLEAEEVDDIRTDRLLAPELVAVELPVAQLRPQRPLGLGARLAQIAGAHGRRRSRLLAPCLTRRAMRATLYLEETITLRKQNVPGLQIPPDRGHAGYD